MSTQPRFALTFRQGSESFSVTSSAIRIAPGGWDETDQDVRITLLADYKGNGYAGMDRLLYDLESWCIRAREWSRSKELQRYKPPVTLERYKVLGPSTAPIFGRSWLECLVTDGAVLRPKSVTSKQKQESLILDQLTLSVQRDKWYAPRQPTPWVNMDGSIAKSSRGGWYLDPDASTKAMVEINLPSFSAKTGSYSFHWTAPKDSTFANNMVFLHWSATQEIKCYYRAADDTFVLLHDDMEAVSAAQTFAAGDQMHLAFTWDASALSIYKNGSLIASAASGSTADTGRLFIGQEYSAGSGAISPAGTLDDVQIWNVAATDSEVTELNEAGCGISLMPWETTTDTSAAHNDQVNNHDDSGAGDTNYWQVYNVPGHRPARARLALGCQMSYAAGSPIFEYAWLGLTATEPSSFDPTFECELELAAGGADAVAGGEASAYGGDTSTYPVPPGADTNNYSNGYAARYTAPSTIPSNERIVVVRLKNDIDQLYKIRGRWHVYARVRSNNTSAAWAIWPYLVFGHTRNPLDLVYFTAGDSTAWTLLDLGYIQLPPAMQTAEQLQSYSGTTLAHSSDIAIELLCNAAPATGATLDFDFLMLMPTQREMSLYRGGIYNEFFLVSTADPSPVHALVRASNEIGTGPVDVKTTVDISNQQISHEGSYLYLPVGDSAIAYIALEARSGGEIRYWGRNNSLSNGENVVRKAMEISPVFDRAIY